LAEAKPQRARGAQNTASRRDVQGELVPSNPLTVREALLQLLLLLGIPLILLLLARYALRALFPTLGY
jgi:hypothetical protein